MDKLKAERHETLVNVRKKIFPKYIELTEAVKSITEVGDSFQDAVAAVSKARKAAQSVQEILNEIEMDLWEVLESQRRTVTGQGG